MTLLAFILAAAFAQDSDPDRLKKFERSVDRDGDGGKSRSSDHRSKDRREHLPDWNSGSGSYSSERRHSSSSETSAVVEFIFAPFAYPFTDHGRRFGWFPYQDEEPYYREEGRKTLAIELSASAGRIESGLRSSNLEGVMSWTSGCDFRFDLMQFTEKVAGGTDRLELQQYQLNFALTPDPGDLAFSLGLGIAALDGEESSEIGFTAQVNFVWFAVKPVSFRLYAGHILFEDASVGDFRAEVGLHFHRFVVTAGIRSLVAEGGEDLTGPTLGLAVFF